MNAPERKVLYLAFCLFVVGVVVRILPWGLPSIESIQIEDAVQPQVASTGKFVTDKVAKSPTDIKDSVSVVELISDSSLSKSEKHPSKRSKKKKKVVLPLRINDASAEDLCALNGVGPKLAEKIIARREAFGPFKTPKDLEKVPGIGKKKLESILPGVIFD